VNQTRFSITNTPRKSDYSKVTSGTTDDVSTVPSTVEVSGIPAGISEDYLRMYFESEKRSGGGEVVHLHYNQTQGTAAVTFLSHTGTIDNQHYRAVFITAADYCDRMLLASVKIAA